MEENLSNARVINYDDLDTSKVVILSTVKIKQEKSGKEFQYTIVSQAEADLKAGKISVNSPIGKGLLGKEVGEIRGLLVDSKNYFTQRNMIIDGYIKK